MSWRNSTTLRSYEKPNKYILEATQVEQCRVLAQFVTAAYNENGAYLVFAIITGQKRTGRRIRRTLIASFQVGPIAQNPVTTAQVLEVRDLLEDRTDPSEVIEALQSDPLAAIKGSQSDPLDAINKLRQGVQ